MIYKTAGIEPQAQFTLGYLGGDNYTASNGINVDQSGIARRRPHRFQYR